jgi:hypothetical protein
MAVRKRARSAEDVAERPFGVYVIALLQAFSAISHASGVLAGLEASIFGDLDDSSAGAYALVLSIGGLVVAFGLLRLRRWAWVVTMFWVGLIMAEQLAFYFKGEDANYVVMAVSIVQVFYLNLSEVQVAFARQQTMEAPS